MLGLDRARARSSLKMAKRKSKMFFLAIFGGALLIIILALSLFEFSPSKPRKIKCVGEDQTILSFSLPNLKGELIDISQFRGKVILLNFWATWCPPCREEIPYLNELYKQYKEKGLVVVGIALDRGGPKEVQKFLEKYEIQYINLMGDEGVLEAFNNIPGMGLIQGIPTTFLIDRKGQICRRFVGLTEKRVFEEAVKQLL